MTVYNSGVIIQTISKIDVPPTLTSIIVSPSTDTMVTAGTQTLTVYAIYNDGTSKDVTVDSVLTNSDNTKITLAGAVITAVAAGTSTVTATYLSFTATCDVTVAASGSATSMILVKNPVLLDKIPDVTLNSTITPDTYAQANEVIGQIKTLLIQNANWSVVSENAYSNTVARILVMQWGNCPHYLQIKATGADANLVASIRNIANTADIPGATSYAATTWNVWDVFMLSGPNVWILNVLSSDYAGRWIWFKATDGNFYVWDDMLGGLLNTGVNADSPGYLKISRLYDDVATAPPYTPYGNHIDINGNIAVVPAICWDDGSQVLLGFCKAAYAIEGVYAGDWYEEGTTTFYSPPNSGSTLWRDTE